MVPNAISGCKDIITLFWENKLGIDVDVSIFILTEYLTIILMSMISRTIIESLYLKGWNCSTTTTY